MPAKNFLTSETKEKLQRALKEHEHPDIRERILAVSSLFFAGRSSHAVGEEKTRQP